MSKCTMKYVQYQTDLHKPRKKEKMTKRPADAISTKLEFEEKPLPHLTDPMSLGRTDYTQEMAPVPLNSFKPESKRVSARVFKQSDTRTDAMIRAEKIQASLSPDLPSLVKFMHPSICSGGFSLGLSIKFCEHLPPEDCEVVLEDEELHLYRTKYLARKKMLSGGWRGFSIAHKLVVGDVVVFQLIALCKMRVSIVRSNSSVKDPVITSPEVKEFPKPQAMVVYDKDMNNADIGNVTDGSPASSEDGIRFSESNISFKDITRFEDFHIIFNGLIIDCEFSKHTRLEYYKLCQSHCKFLHENLLEGINCKLAAGIIIETVNIADAVGASSPSTPKEDVKVWNNTLKAVERFGMSVRFLQEMLNRQISHEMRASEKCGSKTENALLVKLLEVQETARKFHAEIEALRNAK